MFPKSNNMENTLLAFHNECLKTGRMTRDGLCECIPLEYQETLNLFKPDEIGFNAKYGNYWGSDITFDEYNDYNSLHKASRYGGYGILRQTIVLMICAMHNEL